MGTRPRMLCVVVALIALEAWSSTPTRESELADHLQAELSALRLRADELQRALDELRQVSARADVPSSQSASDATAVETQPVPASLVTADGDSSKREVDLTRRRRSWQPPPRR